MNYLSLVLMGVALVCPFSTSVAAEVPGFLKAGKTYKLTFAVPLGIARDPAPPPIFPSPVEESSPKPQRTWFVEVLQIDSSGWILCDTPGTLSGLGGGRNPLIPPVWINLSSVAIVQPISITPGTGFDIPKNPGN
jgi:hypothetical protein